MAAKTVKDVMTAGPMSCTRTDTALTAAGIMRDHDTGVVPVVEGGARPTLAGVVTDRDLCIGVVAEDRLASEVEVQSCMTRNVVSCHPDDPLDRAVGLMQENQIRRIPVVDHDGVLLGILSMADLVRRGDIRGEEAKAALSRVSEPTNQPSVPRADQYRRTA